MLRRSLGIKIREHRAYFNPLRGSKHCSYEILKFCLTCPKTASVQNVEFQLWYPLLRLFFPPKIHKRAKDGTSFLKDDTKQVLWDGDVVHAACERYTPSHALSLISPTRFYFPPNSLTSWLSLLCSVSSPHFLFLVKENQSSPSEP